MKIISQTNMAGKSIHRVVIFDNYAEFPCNGLIIAPHRQKLFNFDVIVKDRSFLILDNYGNESIPQTITRRVIGLKLGYNLAICRTSGICYAAVFEKEGDVTQLCCYPLGDGGWYKVPSAFLSKLDELKNEKRPFDISLTARALLQFVDKEIGYQDLSDELVVQLRFDNFTLEVMKNQYRTTTCWESPEKVID